VLSLLVGIVLLILTTLLVRLVWRTIQRVLTGIFSGHWIASADPRTTGV
jgi:hypothetical protein